MDVDILIDKITDCLIDTRTGEEVETVLSDAWNTDKTKRL